MLTVLKRVTVGVVVSWAASGCVTAQHGREIEAVSDCRRLIAAPGPPPASAKPPRTESAAASASPRFRLLETTLDTSQLTREVLPQERSLDVPLDPADPRIERYFVAIKRRVEAFWVYPREAIGLKQSGSGMAAFTVARDGRLGEVEIVRSTGTVVLDRYLENAIRLAAPFPSIPCPIAEEHIRLTITFRYTLPKAPGGDP